MDAHIRLATEANAAPMLEIYAPVVQETTISFEAQPPSEQEFRGRIRAVLERLPWLVCEDGDAVAGYAYASPFKTRAGYAWSVESSVYVHPGYHRRGIGRALYTALLECLAAQGYSVAVAVITIPNPASIGLHEAMGFRRTGTYEGIGYKFGEWLDDGVWQVALRPRPATPEPPRPLGATIGTAEWDDALAKGVALLKGRST